MIMLGGLLVALGVAGLVGLSIWPTLLSGLGAGMMLSGVMRKGWPRRKEERQDKSDQTSIRQLRIVLAPRR